MLNETTYALLVCALSLPLYLSLLALYMRYYLKNHIALNNHKRIIRKKGSYRSNS